MYSQKIILLDLRISRMIPDCEDLAAKLERAKNIEADQRRDLRTSRRNHAGSSRSHLPQTCSLSLSVSLGLVSRIFPGPQLSARFSFERETERERERERELEERAIFGEGRATNGDR